MHKNIKLLLGASILIHSGTNLLAPIYAIFIKEIGGTLLDAGIAVGVYAIFKGIMYFVFNQIKDDKVSKKVMISSGYFLMAICYLFYIFAGAPIHVFIIQACLSIGEIIINPSWSAIIATSLKKGKERHIYSQFYGYRALFEGGAAILGALSATRFGFDIVFGTMTVFAFLSGVLCLFIKEENLN